MVIGFYFLIVGIFVGTILGENIGKHEKKLDDIKCQICDVSRANYDAKKLTEIDWHNHINQEHNIFAYVYYMLSCCEGSALSKQRMSRTQKYVRRMLQEKNLSFMPVYE